MVNFSDWLSVGQSPADDSFYARRAWTLIQRSPTPITLKRGRTTLPEQIVRVEYSNTEIERTGSDALTALQDAVVFGVIGHPDETVADTDIQRGDLFSLNAQAFRVASVIVVRGGLQARCEAVS